MIYKFRNRNYRNSSYAKIQKMFQIANHCLFFDDIKKAGFHQLSYLK